MRHVIEIWTPQEARRLESWVPTYFRFGSWEHCFYCGSSPQASDHCIPWRFLFSEERRTSNHRGIVTAACNRCNNLLSSYLFSSLFARCVFVREKLAKKNARLLRLPEWKPEELAELRYSLRKQFSAKQELRKQVSNEIAWQMSEKYIEMFDHAYTESVCEFAANKQLHDFMRPPWVLVT